MSILLLEYPKCSTCKKAKKWLEEQGIAFEARHIVENIRQRRNCGNGTEKVDFH